MKKICCIGAGGIGTCLLPPLARVLHYGSIFYDLNEASLKVVDGDSYEPRNWERQHFSELGNKAEIAVSDLKKVFPELNVTAVGSYVNSGNINEIIENDSIVFLCVDNHKTRKMISDHCESLENVILISGGNDLEDGNVQIHIRKNGVNLTNPVASDIHPEIKNPTDKHPDEIKQLGCAEMAAISPQLLIVNNAIASLMLNAFHGHLMNVLTYEEVYCDVRKNMVRSIPAFRKVVTNQQLVETLQPTKVNS